MKASNQPPSESPRRISHLARYGQIASALARHGLGYAAEALGLGRFLPLHRGWLGHARRDEPYTEAEHLRLALEDLGVTFIKLGQILSSRADLVGPEYQRELAKLQDGAPPVPYGEVEEAIVAELGRPIEELFASLDRVPLAAASIGQAHLARLADGTEVVVKVRRPGAVAQVNEDLEILVNLAARASRHSQWAEEFDFVALAREFSETLRAELDYVHEAQNAARFARMFASNREVHIPRVFMESSTSRVLTLERFQGLKATDLAGLDASGIDRSLLAERLAEINLTMVFEHGFFHADPHPGNFFVQADGSVGLIDFGMVGDLSLTLRQQLAALFVAVEARNPEHLVDAFLDICTTHAPIDRRELRQDLERLSDQFYRQELGRLELGTLLNDIMTTVRRYRLQLPSSLALLFKTWMMIEGTVAQLDPRANMATYMAPHVRRLVAMRYLPAALAGRIKDASVDIAALGMELPRRLTRLVDELESGRLTVTTRVTGYEPILGRLETLANRTTIAIISAALIVGLAVLMLFYHPADYERWVGPAFALGALAAAVLGFALAWGILRRKR